MLVVVVVFVATEEVESRLGVGEAVGELTRVTGPPGEASEEEELLRLEEEVEEQEEVLFVCFFFGRYL